MRRKYVVYVLLLMHLYPYVTVSSAVSSNFGQLILGGAVFSQGRRAFLGRGRVGDRALTNGDGEDGAW